MQNFRLFVSLTGVLLVAAGVLVAVLWQIGYFRAHSDWTLATGHPAGSYHQLGEQLAEILNSKLQPTDDFDLLPTAGSAENMAKIGSGEADFAFVQSDTEVAPNARLVAALYDEILHVLVRAEVTETNATIAMPLAMLGELQHVSLGPKGSGTSQVAQLLLEHFEVPLKSPAQHLATSELKGKFADKEIDAAFVLAAPGSSLVKELLDSGQVRLLSLGEGPVGGSPADAFARLHPAFQHQLLPQNLYGKSPEKAIHTVGVSALLVASESVNYRVVRQVTTQLFRHRNQLTIGNDTPLDLGEYTASQRMLLPFHPGAEAYYLRENPSFLVVYAEVIALGLTLLVGLWSVGRLFLHWLADVKKERIDRYYREVREAAVLVGNLRLATLREIHQRAFDELMGERLTANASFVIFHDYLLSEIVRAEQLADDGHPKA